MFRDLLAVIAPVIDAQRAFDDASAIHSVDRHFRFSSFHESARYSAERLRGAGLSDVQIVEAPADGRSVFGDWKMPLAWEVTEASFDLIASGGGVQRIADRGEVPQCLAMWSGPTSPEGVEAEIVRVKNPADTSSYAPEMVRGKIVFTSSHPHQVKRLLADLGVVGVLSDHLHRGARLPDATAWVNSWSDDPGGWGFVAGDTPSWAFLISPNQGEKIRARLEAGERLRGRAVVRSRLEPGTLPAITGVISGGSKEEVVLIGHQFEVGAIDNAAGIAIMIEAVRALQQLIGQAKLAAPTRSIRVLFVSECYSNLYWWEKSKRARHTVAGLCLDSPVGAPDLALRPMEIHVNPHAQMSYTDALVTELTRQVMAADPIYAWGEVPFSMTDNLIADTTINIPCPWIGGHSRTWHTSADTAKLLPVEVMGLVGQITAAYAYLAATADREQVLDFAHLAAARGKQSLSAAGVSELSRLRELRETDLDDAMTQISYLAERHAEAVASVLHLVPAPERRQMRPHVRALGKETRRAGRDEAAALARQAGRPGHVVAAREPEGALAAIRPRRLVLGPVAFDRLTPEQREGRPSPRWSPALFFLLNWCDGKRSLAEACHLAAREVRDTRTLRPDELAKQIDPTSPSMPDYFEFLRRSGYVSW